MSSIMYRVIMAFLSSAPKLISSLCVLWRQQVGSRMLSAAEVVCFLRGVSRHVAAERSQLMEVRTNGLK